MSKVQSGNLTRDCCWLLDFWHFACSKFIRLSKILAFLSENSFRDQGGFHGIVESSYPRGESRKTPAGTAGSNAHSDRDHFRTDTDTGGVNT
jgi:hypothetical protein